MKIKDIASVVSESVPYPAESGFEKFVGLEHYDAGEPKITRYGSTDMLKTAMKHFLPGDVLVARRNVYLRRAGIVDFEGLTSGDSIVLRPQNDDIARYLPFILNSNAFWDFADANSDGTMSKRLSPKTLLDYEFDLPPIEEQRVLADKLWAAYRLKESYRRLLTATQEMVKSQFIEMFGDPVTNPKGLPTKKGNELFIFSSGKANTRDKLDDSNPYPCYGGNGITGFSKDFLTDIETLAIGRVGEYCGCVHYIKGKAWITDNAIYIKECLTNDYSKQYLYQLFTMLDFHKLASETGQPKITQKPLQDCDYILPPMELQQQFVAIAEQADKSGFDGIKSQFIEMFGDPVTNPKGLPMKTIKDVCKISGGSQPPRTEFVFEPKEGYVRFIQIRDYKSDDHITYIKESSTKKFCEADDIMIGRYGPPIFQILKGIKGAYNVALMKAEPIKVNKEFLRFYLSRDQLREHLEQFQSRSAGQAGIEMSELYSYPFPDISMELQQQFVAIVEQADKSGYYYMN